MNILIINPYGIGDVLFTFPLIDSLKINYPHCYLGYLCNDRVEPLLKCKEEINECFVYEKDDWRLYWKESKFQCLLKFREFLKKIKEKKFDICLDFSLAPEFSFFCWVIGIKKRIGYGYKKRGIFLNQKLNINGYHSQHMVEYYLNLLRFLGIKPQIKEIKLKLPAPILMWAKEIVDDIKKEVSFLIGIIPGGGASWGKQRFRKQWPNNKFKELILILRQNLKAGIIILGDKNDAKDFYADFGEDRYIFNYMGKTSLIEASALISQCDVVVCNDGGPLHIAVSLGIPTLSIFGPVDPLVYGPYPPSKIHRVIRLKLPCQPCYRNFKLPFCKTINCLRDLSVDYVYQSLRYHLLNIGVNHERNKIY